MGFIFKAISSRLDFVSFLIVPLLPNMRCVAVLGAVGKITAFQPQGPQFDSQRWLDLNICST